MDSRGFPTTLPEFQRVFPDDAASARYLEHLRWPHGFTCFKCGNVGEPYRFAKRRTVVLRCRACHSNISLTAGTVMRQSHTPLSTWFWGAYLVTCLLYTSDAADDLLCVDLGGRRLIKKKTHQPPNTH